MQEREDDEDINTPDTTATPPPTRLLDCHRFGSVKRYFNVPMNTLHLYLVLRHLTLGRGPCICINYLAQTAATTLGYLDRPPPWPIWAGHLLGRLYPGRCSCEQ